MIIDAPLDENNGVSSREMERAGDTNEPNVANVTIVVPKKTWMRRDNDIVCSLEADNCDKTIGSPVRRPP